MGQLSANLAMQVKELNRSLKREERTGISFPRFFSSKLEQGRTPYDEITWELRPAPNAGEISLMFSHTGWGDDYPREEYAHVNYTWGQIVGRLKAYAETGQPQPFFALAAASHP